MGAYGRHVKALLRRNLLYRKRSWFGSLLQLVMPAFMIGILLIIKDYLKDDDFFKPELIPAKYPEESLKTFSFLDYITAVKTERKCTKMTSDIKMQLFKENAPTNKCMVSGINPVNWPVPFLKCDYRKCNSTACCVDEPQDASGVCSGVNVCSVNVLAIAPFDETETGRADSFLDYILETYPQIEGLNMLKVFSSSQQIDDYVVDKEYGNTTLGKPQIAVAVVLGGSGKDYEYTIRTNSTNYNSLELTQRPAMPTNPDTKRKFYINAKDPKGVCQLQGGTTPIGKKKEQCTVQYMYNGALTIQRLVDDFIIHDTGAKDKGFSVAENGVSFVDFPSKEFVKDGFYAQIGPYASLLLVLGLLYPVSAIIRSVVSEKELRQKELMKMLSISESAIELSWFISSYGFFAISALFSTIVSSYLYPLASPLLLFIFWETGFLSVTLFALTITAFFSKATRATLFGIIFFFGGYLLTLFAEYDTGSLGVISLISFHPLAAIAYGIEIIGNLEEGGVGVNGSTFNFTDNPSGYTFAACITNLIRNALFWGAQMWYYNRVIPGDHSQGLPWYFPYQKSYWCRNKENNVDLEDWEQSEKYDRLPIEPVGPSLKEQDHEGKGVHIRGLTKKFDEKTAVDGLDLDMYNGQVFSLLGHNGAGKTTTISMLSGMLAPTEGFAVINGKDIRTQMQEIREDLGICLQHDCLFPLLTVKEHIRFFARIKGLYDSVSFEDAENSVDNSIRDVALFEKRNTFSKDLSGGMKRKLSLAIAFCGGSKVVFLDEPTSGMDPFSRRFIWNVIRQNKQDRCIVLTTHFMDEADILGDRIAIMSEGHLRCVGGSLFLKKEFGVGYHVTIEKGSDSELVTADVKKIVTETIPNASILSNVSSEITFRLPLDAADRFPEMFIELDKKIDEGIVSTYGVGITTLDEVFLQVARGESLEKTPQASSRVLVADNRNDHNHSSSDRSGSDRLNSSSYRSQEDISDPALFAGHVRSLFAKRAMYFKRDKKAWACSTFLPVLFSFFGFINVTMLAPSRLMQPLELKTSDYNDISGGKIAFPINEPENFVCEPAKCLGALAGNYYDDDSYCGNDLLLNNTAEQCSAVTIDNFSDGLDSTNYIPISQNVSNIMEASKQIEKNSDEFDEEQYGALYFTHTLDTVINSTQESFKTTIESLCGAHSDGNSLFGEFDCANFAGLGYVVSTNFVALHSSLYHQGLADQTIVRTALDDNNYNIKTTIHPLPITEVESEFARAENSFLAWFSLVLSFPFIAGTFGTFIVQERMTKAKHLQTVAGVKPSAYWLSSYGWDIMNYQLPLWIVVILMFALGVDAFTTTEYNVRSATIVIMFLFGPAITGFTYVATFLFKSPSKCNMFIIVFNFFVGLAGSLVVLILRFIYLGTVLNGGTSNLKYVAQIIEWVLRPIPSFCLGKGLLFSTNISAFVLVEGKPLDAWSDAIMGTEIIFLAIESVVYIILAIHIDIWSTRPSIVRYFTRKPAKADSEEVEEEDEDVIEEAERVQRGDANSDKIVLNELTKQYPNGKVAVNGLSIGIPAGQCFGLLGINGAGKTTTMGILTAEFPPTSGDATLATYSVTSQPEETRKRIGYCPQFDAHFMNLTGLEHVKLYASIKGISRDVIDEAARSKLSEVGINEFDSNRLSSQYSGGMKRKLSVACATIGNPEIVFIDEASTGMDPVSRRDLWEVISKMVVADNDPGHRCSVILTTHSMEECEALCPRIGIMAGGKLKCIGSAQRLKNRFGQGFQVEVKVDEPTKTDDDLKEVIFTLLDLKGNVPNSDPESGNGNEEIFFNLDGAISAAQKVSGDNYISDKITEDDVSGNFIFKSASSDVGVELEGLAAFFTITLRLKSVMSFFAEEYKTCTIRETQDTRMRFEVPSAGVKISSLFSCIEENKEKLHLQDYGISQTTLEQVFNMHAAAAEAAKEGTDDA